MLTAEEILDQMGATPRERRLLDECVSRVRAKAEWNRKKQSDPSMKRQSRYHGPSVAELLEGEFDDDPVRFAWFMTAFKARTEI